MQLEDGSGKHIKPENLFQVAAEQVTDEGGGENDLDDHAIIFPWDGPYDLDTAWARYEHFGPIADLDIIDPGDFGCPVIKITDETTIAAEKARQHIAGLEWPPVLLHV